MTAAGGTSPGVADLRREEVVLPGVPSLGRLYARGAAASGRLVLARRFGRGPVDLPEVAYVVAGVQADAAHLTAYQHLLGETASDVLPAGFVHVLAFPVATAVMARPDFPLPLAGLVHLANEITQHVPLRLGQAVDVRAWAQGLAAHRTGTTVELVTEVRLAGPARELREGPVAWRGVSTYLAKGTHLVRGGAGDDGGAGVADGVEGTGGADGRSGSGSGARPAFVAPVPTARWELDAGTGRRYAAVSGDRNPIHLSAVSAKALGFPRAIAHGMDTAARALATVGAERGDAFTWSVEFAKPVLLPGSVAVRVAADDGPGGGWTYAGWHPRSGKVHLTGSVRPL
ncbi:MaoC/PaaZ C-terminal domain-containing protein [Cellulomonas cellasea]|uniref:Dehydratase n=2 Tax=Cellulomonas cellasea TaxID=43670 RepID=A0A0A0B5W4_9CELL|nr:MaoC/PaaZ C-terminal domain-containing protein [Cellulomonas cellasea]KGM01209.1 dehydratase [Cellulomonas cellasea DSM 20118]GEA87826.1 acyl dehydratase [Cellulomonas cellasea]